MVSVKVEPVAPAIFRPFLRHCSDGDGSPVAMTEKVAVSPTSLVSAAGCGSKEAAPPPPVPIPPEAQRILDNADKSPDAALDLLAHVVLDELLNDRHARRSADEDDLGRYSVIDGKQRWNPIGTIGGLVVVIVSHTYRDEGDEEVVRIISARRASRRERREYESR